MYFPKEAEQKIVTPIWVTRPIKGAKVPVVMATLDFENKQIKISEPYVTTDS